MADYNLLLVENVLIKDIFIEPVSYLVGRGGELTEKTESNRFFFCGHSFVCNALLKTHQFQSLKQERPRRTQFFFGLQQSQENNLKTKIGVLAYAYYSLFTNQRKNLLLVAKSSRPPVAGLPLNTRLCFQSVLVGGAWTWLFEGN